MTRGLTGLLVTLLVAAPAVASASGYARGSTELCPEAAGTPGVAPLAPLARDGVADEEALDEEGDANDEPEYSPVLVASVDPSRNCSEAPTSTATPAVLDCNAANATAWAHEMIGTCAMPATTSHPSVAAPRRQRPAGHEAAACHGADCVRDPLPLRAGGDDENPSWFAIGARIPSGVLLDSSPLVLARDAPLASVPTRRDERPPKRPSA